MKTMKEFLLKKRDIEETLLIELNDLCQEYPIKNIDINMTKLHQLDDKVIIGNISLNIEFDITQMEFKNANSNKS